MVMRPDPRMGALTTVRRRNFGPWWLWTIVVLLALGAGYSGYLAHFSNQRLSDTSAALTLLGADNEGLKASLAEAKEQLKAATARADKAEQDSAAISALLAKQQKRADELRTQLSGVRREVAASKAEAEKLTAQAKDLEAKTKSAEDAFAQVRNLQERLAELKEAGASDKATITKLKEDAAAAATARASLEREIDELKAELNAARANKAEVSPTTTAQPSTP